LASKKFLCIHGHFYQPPRENPWLEAVELQESAYPYHDWNQRITAECYAPNSAARILDEQKRIAQIVNNYARISFNFGPTLLSWLEANEPAAYSAIIAADKESRDLFSGHGSALAQCFNHMIMPLASRRDKETQVAWGIRDFERRFGRKAEGMWLPEAAVDLETLDLLAAAGVRFTILAPRQAKAVRKLEEKKWHDVSGGKVDPKCPYLCHLPSGRTITIFFYDGPISQSIAFEGLLANGEGFAHRLLNAFTSEPGTQLVHIATDGETYGHHHKMGDMALAYCLDYIEHRGEVTLTNYGEFLDKFPPIHEVEIFEESSWSCIHGVERWRNNCGCHSGMHPGWQQHWRAPLRTTLDRLRDQLYLVFEKEGAAVLSDVWRARDEYIDVILDRSRECVDAFLSRHSAKNLTKEEKVKALKLLEMQRHAMLMYTSCGWFFDEISGIETVQIMQYAARAIQLAEPFVANDLEKEFQEGLNAAPSNISMYGNGGRLYDQLIRPSRLDLTRVGAHYAVSSLFEEYSGSTEIYSYRAEDQLYDRLELGRQKFAVGKALVRSNITWEEKIIAFAVIHLGDHNLLGGVSDNMDERTFSRMHQSLKERFRRNDISGATRMIGQYFPQGEYSLKHLFRDEQSKILLQIFDSTLEEIEASLRQINEHHYPIIQVIRQMRIPLPQILSHTVLVMLNTDLIRVLGSDVPDILRLEELVREIQEWSLDIDKVTLGFVVKRRVTEMMAQFELAPQDIERLKSVEAILRVLGPLSLTLDLWKTENIYFALGKNVYPDEKKRAEIGDKDAAVWVGVFEALGRYLRVRFN